MSEVTVHHGDSREVLKTLADASIDAVVCDPPYALVSIGKRFGKEGAAPAKAGKTGAYARASKGFMGKTWDTGETAFSAEFWVEVARVLKPGGHVIAFSGTRTYHRLACAVEDAGFEIRDMVAWLYGSGFPKSHDVSKGIDKARPDHADWRAVGKWLRSEREAAGLKQKTVAALWPSATGGLTGCVANWELGLSCPLWHQWLQLKARIGFGDEMDAEVWRLNGRKGTPGNERADRVVMGPGDNQVYQPKRQVLNAGTPILDAARQWEGWGTALKPALEPIVLARKPLDGTVAANVLVHGPGALNIRESRVCEAERWPANVTHDGSAEVVQVFPVEAGAFAPVRGTEPSNAVVNVYGERTRVATLHHGDSGSAARFFYSAKADAEDRLGSKHPTVKPIDLMAWLCRLVTPPGGTILDPFAGTGTTGLAAMREGFDCILIEREAEYVADIERRLAWAKGEGRLTAQETARTESKSVDDLPLFSASDAAA